MRERVSVGAVLLPIFPVRRAPILNVRPARAMLKEKVEGQICPSTKNEQLPYVFEGEHNQNGDGGEEAMTNQYQLTRDEIAICRRTNTPVDKYVAARAAKLLGRIPVGASRLEKAVHAAGAQVRPVSIFGLGAVFEQMVIFARTRSEGNLRAALNNLKGAIGLAAAQHLTEAEVRICHQTNTGPAQFALQKKHTAGTEKMIAGVAMREMPIKQVDPRTGRYERAAHRSQLPDPGQPMDVPGLLKVAVEDINKFLADSEHLDALQFLISAEAWVKQALRQSGARARSAAGWE
jgi:hypothetical protein